MTHPPPDPAAGPAAVRPSHGSAPGGPGAAWSCPRCGADLLAEGTSEPELHCSACDARYPIPFGIPDLRIAPDPYLGIDEDRAKARALVERSEDQDFAGLVGYYYASNAAVTPAQARRFTHALLAGVARADAALSTWGRHDLTLASPTRRSAAPPSPTAVSPGHDAGRRAGGHAGRDREREGHRVAVGPVLDVGCGTGPLLAAVAGRGVPAVGVDIGLRWLVLARKRLQELGLDVPLVCACAEALPFRRETFDRVAMDSVLEHVRDPRRALAEAHRMLTRDGRLLIATPNRFSLGPDPRVGIWAAGYIPSRWLARWVERRGMLPPEHPLLSAPALSRLVREAGFAPPHLELPRFAPAQRAHLGRPLDRLIDLYHAAARLPIARELLLLIGPAIFAVSERP